MLDADGALDRARLGAIVFGDDVARADLNAIVHPEVRRRYDELVAEALGAPLDLLLVRKIGAPGQPELALGAVVEGHPDRRTEAVELWTFTRTQGGPRLLSAIQQTATA